MLNVRSLKKCFGRVTALRKVDFDVEEGEIHGLVGENGAGKSTLMRILSGVYPHGSYEGSVKMNGRQLKYSGTRDAENDGIIIIHQELNIIPELTVAENIFLSHLPVNKLGFTNYQKMLTVSNQILSDLRVDFDGRTMASQLSNGQKQMVELARAISLNARILIFDEPTSSLSDHERETLWKVIEELHSKGVSIIYISHKLDEIFKLCDRITVLRDGETIATTEAKDIKAEKVVELMVGRALSDFYPPKPLDFIKPKLPALSIKNWQVRSKASKVPLIEGVDLEVFPGEILGIAGLMGSKRSELIMSIFGHQDFISTGQMEIDGKVNRISSPRDAMNHGIALLTEDRKLSGLHLEHSIEDNICISRLEELTNRVGSLNFSKITALGESLVRRLLIKVDSIDQDVRTLSGGNQQKVAIAKCLAIRPKIIFLDEPTRGIDVNAKFEIYRLIRELVKDGVAIIMVSSELPELIGMADRVAIMREGRIRATLEGTNIEPNQIMKHAVGLQP